MSVLAGELTCLDAEALDLRLIEAALVPILAAGDPISGGPKFNFLQPFHPPSLRTYPNPLLSQKIDF